MFLRRRKCRIRSRATLMLMTARYAIADVASLVGEPTRAAILLALLDGRALPAGALARAARLSAPATSLHLAKLRQGALLAMQQEGRHRYYRPASPDAPHAVSSAFSLCAGSPVPPTRGFCGSPRGGTPGLRAWGCGPPAARCRSSQCVPRFSW